MSMECVHLGNDLNFLTEYIGLYYHLSKLCAKVE